MKIQWNDSQRLLSLLLFAWLSIAAGSAQALPFTLPQGAGTFRLGVVCGDESRWLDQCRIKEKGQTYTIKDKLWKEGEVKLTLCPLTDSKGFIMEISGEKLPEDARLCWTFGGCDNTYIPTAADNRIPIAACHDNVFSVEGNAVTVYYGEVMRLRTIHAVTPVGSCIRLSDARQQESPLLLYHSGKKTDAPVISALCPWKPQEKLYFCFYKQNAKADYNYFMLPALFEKEFKAR